MGLLDYTLSYIELLALILHPSLYPHPCCGLIKGEVYTSLLSTWGSLTMWLC